jgi:hypothetical protein
MIAFFPRFNRSGQVFVQNFHNGFLDFGYNFEHAAVRFRPRSRLNTGGSLGGSQQGAVTTIVVVVVLAAAAATHSWFHNAPTAPVGTFFIGQQE